LAVEGYTLTNGPCKDCPHPARGVPTQGACRALCDKHESCEAWVHNTRDECYLKRGTRLHWRRGTDWGGRTWSAPRWSRQSNPQLPDAVASAHSEATQYCDIASDAPVCWRRGQQVRRCFDRAHPPPPQQPPPQPPPQPSYSAAAGAMPRLNVSNTPSPTRTAVYVAMAGPLTTIKTLIFERLLCTSLFDVVVGVDMGQSNATSRSVLSLIRAAQQRTKKVAQVVRTSYAQLERRHTARISNFAGGGSGGSQKAPSPAKLAALDWLASARYDHMWHLEDDAWSADFGIFASRYASSTADLIIRNRSWLPHWAQSGWKIGSPRHVLQEGTFRFASLAVYRASRTFARTVLHTIAREVNQTSHHELYLPYVISRYPQLAWESLRPGHQALFSTGRLTDFEPLCALRRAEMYHPVKSECGAIEGYNLLNGACRGCPHPARDVADWSACRQLCDRWRPLSSAGDNCTGWVYNSKLRCYLKSGKLQWKREVHAWAGTTWSGPTSSSRLPVTLPVLSETSHAEIAETSNSTRAHGCIKDLTDENIPRS